MVFSDFRKHYLCRFRSPRQHIFVAFFQLLIGSLFRQHLLQVGNSLLLPAVNPDALHAECAAGLDIFQAVVQINTFRRIKVIALEQSLIDLRLRLREGARRKRGEGRSVREDARGRRRYRSCEIKNEQRAGQGPILFFTASASPTWDVFGTIAETSFFFLDIRGNSSIFMGKMNAKDRRRQIGKNEFPEQAERIEPGRTPQYDVGFRERYPGRTKRRQIPAFGRRTGRRLLAAGVRPGAGRDAVPVAFV